MSIGKSVFGPLLSIKLFINSRTAIIGLDLAFTTRRGVLVFLGLLRLEEEYWFSLGFFLQEVDLFTRHFDLKAKVRKAVLVNRFSLSERSSLSQIFAKRDHALRLVNDFLTLKSSFD